MMRRLGMPCGILHHACDRSSIDLSRRKDDCQPPHFFHRSGCQTCVSQGLQASLLLQETDPLLLGQVHLQGCNRLHLYSRYSDRRIRHSIQTHQGVKSIWSGPYSQFWSHMHHWQFWGLEWPLASRVFLCVTFILFKKGLIFLIIYILNHLESK